MYLTPKILVDTASTIRCSVDPHTTNHAWPKMLLKRTWFHPFRAVYDDHPLGGHLGQASTASHAVLVMYGAGMYVRKAKLTRTAHEHLRPGQRDMVKRRRFGWVPAV